MTKQLKLTKKTEEISGSNTPLLPGFK